VERPNSPTDARRIPRDKQPIHLDARADIVAIANVLKKELSFDSLTPSWRAEDGTDDFTVGILARWGDIYHGL